MSEQKQHNIILTDDQKDALVQSFFPAMLEFFKSDKGKKIYSEYLENKDDEKSAPCHVTPTEVKCKSKCNP